MDEKKSTDILSGDNKAPLVIFKTEEDKTGVNILKMSNFFDGYVHEMMISICDSSTLQDITQLPIVDLSMIEDVIKQMLLLKEMLYYFQILIIYLRM